MEVIYCLCEDQRLLLGIPPTLGWSIKANPCEGGCTLTLHVDGAKDVLLLGGNPVNLCAQNIEVTNFAIAYPHFSGSAEYIDASQLSDEIGYLEVGRNPKSAKVLASPSEVPPAETKDSKQEPCVDNNAFYKWSQIIAYLGDRLGTAPVSFWLDDARVIEFTEERLKVEAGSEFRCEIIKRRCVNHIQDALKSLFNSEAVVELSYRKG